MNLSLNELLNFLKSKNVTIVFITDKRKNSVVFNGDIKKAITFAKKEYKTSETRGHVSCSLNFPGAFIDLF